MDTINSYDTDLLKITREENSNTAHILSGENQLGTIFLKSNDTLEIPEREYHLLEDLYSIDIGTLIEDIEKQKLGNYRDYLTGVSSLEQELNHLDTLQNALHCLSNHLNFIVIRQGEIFKAYNGKEWLENYLGSVKVNDLEIKPDEELINNLLEQYSFLLNQLTIDIIKGEQSIEIENYIITSEPIKELLIKETWNEQDLETANNLLNKLVESTPPWNELTETIRHKHQKIFEKDPEQTDDNDTNNGGSITPTPSPKNPNNNGSQTIESTKEELDTLFSAIQSYQTDLNIQKNNNKLTFYQQKYRLGSVELNPNKLVAEEGLIANLKISYGIDIKGLIESIEFASLDNCFELDPFEHIGKSNPAIFIPGCVVAPTWKEGRGLQGVLQLVNGQVATIQWLNSLDHGDNVPEQVNIGLLRYIAAQQTAKNDSLHTEALSDEPTAENFAALKFGGLIAATTVNNTNTNKENSEVVENTTASSFPDDNEDLIWEDLTWMDAIKVKLEKLEGFTVSHDEVDLTAWHYGTKVGSIHHNEENELEIEQKLIGELAKYNFDLEAFLVNLNIPYKFYHLKPVVITPTTERSDLQTSEQESSSEQKMTKKPPVEELNYQVNGKSISFGLTLPQLLSEQKTVTRRMWKDSYAKRFLNDWNARPGEFLYPALTKSYRVGGKQVGYIKLTHQPYQEKLADIPTSDLAAEGFPELSRAEFINKFFDGNDQQIAWVIRFDFIPNKEKPENNAEQIGENSPLPLDLLDQMTAVFDGLESIRTSRSGNVLWFYRGSENLYPCSMKTFDDNTSTLFPTVKLNDKMKELYGIDIDRVCYDLETGKEVNINNYIDHSVLEQTIKDSHKNNDTITWQDLLNNAAYLDITDSQTSDELNTSTTTEQSQTNTEEHPERLHWLKDTSMFNRSETYIVWNGTQKCGKINLCNKSKNKAGFGKWYVSPNVFGPYYDTIEKAATACWQDFISQNAEQTATQEDLIPF
ncbi:hypothetical protein [Okeania sp. KiyG1]|nr:hypothetical protein [Okeania sp. KiyG1]GGA01898.1 hypothetical protein CYANOKiyG1_13790 [Okeania sp. KiyG1]GGA56932.1 hypothetical protein CYANOKiyG1_77860 [Okeania sp. KiyG1]GGA57412.1 hypothetical protein CYANOKiyG1_78470 [Okeania sp. KiyG1]